MGRVRNSGRGRSAALYAVRRVLPALGIALVAAAWVAPRSVSAEVTGVGCSAHIAGVDAATVSSVDQSTAVHVQRTDTIPVDLSGEPGQKGVHVDYGLAGGISVGKDGTGTQYGARVSDYVSVTGLYLVIAHSTPNSACSAAALVQIDGNPLGTLVGDAALGITAVGGLMVGGGTALAAAQKDDTSASPFAAGGEDGRPTLYDTKVIRSAGRPVFEEGELGFAKSVGVCGAALSSALVMTTLAMMGALPTAATEPAGPSGPPRAAWRPRLSVLGLLGGLLGSAGAVVLMELNGNVFPTRRWTAEALVGGLLAGLILPSLGNAIAVIRINRRRARIAA